MTEIRTHLLRKGLDLLHASRIYRAFAPFWAGRGVIFMLHHIRPASETPKNTGFHPNDILEITPEFLSDVITRVRKSGLDILSMERAVERLQLPESHPFAVFTIDDGYLDNFEHALPVFEKHNCPFTVFVTPKIIQGTCELWWQALEHIIAEQEEVSCLLDGETISYKTVSPQDKQRAYQAIYWQLRYMEQTAQRVFIREFAEKYNLNLEDLCATQAMNWQQVRELQTHPLVTIGAHSVNHYALALLSETDALAELIESRNWIAKQTGYEPAFFCYPYGDPRSAGPRDFELAERAGYKASVTTRKGLLYDAHSKHLSALPRVSLNGDYQDLKYIDLYLSGAPFALWNRFRKLNVA